MKKVSPQTQRQILLLGVPLIMKIKSEDKIVPSDLTKRLEYLKSKGIVNLDYTIENLVNDTRINITLSELPFNPISTKKVKKGSRKSPSKKSRSKSRSIRN
jgi:hypothetical protein